MVPFGSDSLKTGKSTSGLNFYASSHQYADQSDDDNGDASEEILKRKKAWAELEREQDEVKRSIKSLLKTKPESRVMDDPILAERVRSSAYKPQKYDQEDIIIDESRNKALKEEVKRLEPSKERSSKKESSS